ncbi:MAG: CPBP family intramembrane metalloprotease, partial [Ignavibacteriae bacterium]|nr:CPBP family intramembrane metalloprotease [Ignavibacteriota bacterium]
FPMVNTESRQELLRQVFTFVVITIVITTGIFIWMFNGAKDNMGAVFAMMWTPGISAIITSLIYKDKIRNYGWKPGKARFLIYAYLLPLVISLIAYGLVWLSGYTEFTTQEVIKYKWAKMLGFELPVPFIIGVLSKMSLGFLFTCLPVLGEEIGWSGFLTPKLLKIFSVPVTSLIVGLFWAVWHYPAIIGGFYGQGTPLWIALPGFTLSIVGESFIRTVLVSKSKSLWTGVVLHASANIIFMGMFYEMTVHKGYAAYIVSETGIFAGIVYITIALIFWKLQPKKTMNPELI